MSYDLLVFEPDAAPKEPVAFMEWFRGLAEWSEGHNYDDPANTKPALQAWYRDMIATFPAMNGPDAVSDEEISDAVTGYSFAEAAIYADFRWSEAGRAKQTSFNYAQKHCIGFWDASSSVEVWGPTENGGYEVWFNIKAAQ